MGGKMRLLGICMVLTMLLLTATLSTCAKTTKISYWTVITEEAMFKAGIAKAVEKFEKAYPDIEVNVQQIPFAQYDTKVTTAAEAGSPPDVGRVNHVTLSTWAAAGYLEPLDNRVAQTEVIVPYDYYEGFWEATFYKGTQYALPLGTDNRAFWYNMQIFKEAGLNPPRTWEELVKVAEVLDKEGTWAIPLQTDNHWANSYEYLGAFLVDANGYVINPEGTKAIASENKATRETFKLVYEDLKPYYPAGVTNMDSNTVATLFAKNKLGCIVGGPWMKTTCQQTNPDFEFQKDYNITPLPLAPGRVYSGSSQGGWFVGLFSGSDNKEAAWRFIEFLQRPEITAIVDAPENFPARRAAARFKPWAGNPFYEPFMTMLPHSRPPYALVPQLPQISETLYKYSQKLLLGQISVEEALRKFDEEVNSTIL